MTKALHCHPSLLIYCVELVYAPAVLGVLRVAIMLKRWPMFFCWKIDPIQKETLYTYVCIESFPSIVLHLLSFQCVPLSLPIRSSLYHIFVYNMDILTVCACTYVLYMYTCISNTMMRTVVEAAVRQYVFRTGIQPPCASRVFLEHRGCLCYSAVGLSLNISFCALSGVHSRWMEVSHGTLATWLVSHTTHTSTD